MELGKPRLLVDLNQAEVNLRELARHIPNSIKIRLASKSIRSPDLLKHFLKILGPRACGVMCYHPDEIQLLHKCGIDNVLLAYPNYSVEIAERLANYQRSLANHQKMYLMVDLPEHMQVLSVAAHKLAANFKIILDVDVSTPLYGIYFGVYRSSVRGASGVKRALLSLAQHPNLRLCGTMTYEAQVAGIPDFDPRENSVMAFIKRHLKRRSARDVAAVRHDLKIALAESQFTKLEIHNGGGSGSVGSTPKHDLINEVTVGSGILCPNLFEHYSGLNLKPAIAYALPIVRKPYENVRTAYSGGYIASGAHSENKQPTILWPKGWQLIAAEGLGEVQTPIVRRSERAPELGLNDQIFFIPAKSGEVMERFLSVQTADLHACPPVIGSDEFLTYRGLGECFG